MTVIKNKLLSVIATYVLLMLAMHSQAQVLNNLDLAKQYESTGEYDKAAVYYEKQYDVDPIGTYDAYLRCLKTMQDNKEAEKLIKKQLKKTGNAGRYQVDLGLLYESEGENEKARKQFETVIKNLRPEPGEIYSVAGAFMMAQKTDYAIEVYQKGRTFGLGTNYGFELADLYGRKGDPQKMIDEYLNLMEENNLYTGTIQSVLQQRINQDPDHKLSDLLRTSLLRRIQKQPGQIIYSEFLYWLFLQDKDFESALIQAKALDKKNDDSGSRVFQLGEICVSNSDWKVAEKCFNTILEKGSNHPMYIQAKMASVRAAYEHVVHDPYTPEELTSLDKRFKSTLDELGTNTITAPLWAKYAHLQAFYLHHIEEGSNTLEKIIAIPGLTPTFIAECKLELGDILILEGNLWDASLTYSQVDKDFKNDALGREAKFRNARLSYYLGEFDWAVAQLNVLKQATSQLISNDALDLSLLISDNIGDDSITEPLRIYSRAELLAFQNKDDEALATLDSILTLYPGRKITTRVWFTQASIYLKKQNPQKAIQLYQFIVDQYADDILADDALFRIASVYENILNDKEKAQAAYEKLIDKYPASLFVAEARKHYRLLRGDRIN
ncbi:MAG: tetratricopeptide repeat protein [Bacteroidetes bacterium]|jgi:tetratricopeptide (TPR) repeat protein|nr:tetratricopeptide repeat protein [Bacteroidota bacterium]